MSKFMDPSEALKAAENSLRDLFNFMLPSKLGENWLEKCGVTLNRIQQWQGRQQEDGRKFGFYDPRVIYYADFYDLKTILKKNWEKGLSDVFGNLREMEVLLDILADLRNPDAHRRELLPYQKHLALGIAGKIRTKITGYLSNMETRDSYYSKIESVQDSLGNTWSIGDRNPFPTNCILRPGDNLQFQVTGSDPKGDAVEFGLLPLTMPFRVMWSSTGSFDLTIDQSHIKEVLWIFIAIKSPRNFHPKDEVGLGAVDDIVKFGFEVLPPRN
jgi:hypothetical protein